MDKDEELMNDDIAEIITHAYYADGKVIKTETEYIYKEKVLRVEENDCPSIPIGEIKAY